MPDSATQAHYCYHDNLLQDSMYSTSRSCLHSFLCNPDIPFKMLIYLYITPTVVGVYRDWPGCSPLNLYI